MNDIQMTDNLAEVLKAIDGLTTMRVLVGIPDANADRERPDGEPINNAQLGYINETGSPDSNLPARPSLIPGVQKVLPQVATLFRQAATAALDGDKANTDAVLEKIGMRAAASVRETLTAGEGFAPLTDAALRSRLQRAQRDLAPGKVFKGKKSVRQELAIRQGKMERPEGFVSPKPLIDTGELRRSFTYVVENK